jgi:hypothetical protein
MERGFAGTSKEARGGSFFDRATPFAVHFKTDVAASRTRRLEGQARFPGVRAGNRARGGEDAPNGRVDELGGTEFIFLDIV